MADSYLRIKALAEKARTWTERYAKVKKFPANLNGLCAIGSAKLFEMLDREVGLNPELAVWHDKRSEGVHCFIVCNEYIVDITATQFGNFLPVEILNKFKIDRKRHYFWNADTYLKSVEDFMMYQEEIQWVERSQVTEKVLSWA